MAAQIGSYGLDKPEYRLRWRFDFFDHKPSRMGVWNNSTNLETDGAWCVNKTNLRRAAIEGESVITWEQRLFLEIAGHDFVNFQWLVVTPVGLGINSGGPRDGVYRPTIVGLAGISTDFISEIYIDGSYKVRERSEHDKLNKLAAWRK